MRLRIEVTSDDVKGRLLAVLYDWHNRLCLKAQNADLDYLTSWVRSYSGTCILVGGCGTGRVAAAMCNAGFQVTGVDIDPHRLSRAALSHPSLKVSLADLRDFRSSSKFDVTILPYSTVQLVPPGQPLQDLARSIAACTSGHVIVDVSDHFAQKHSHGWRVILDAQCPELEAQVVESQKAELHEDHYKVLMRFSVNDNQIEVTERWYFHPDTYLRSIFADAGLYLHLLERGYGDDQTAHRRIYHFTVANRMCERRGDIA